MPWIIQQISARRYAIYNPITGQIHSKSTTWKKAQAQVRLLRYIEQEGGKLYYNVM